MAKYDWALIKREFIRGYKDPTTGEYVPKPTLKQVADRHGCNYGTIRKRAAPKEEDWEQQRNIFSTKKEQRITEKEIEKISDESVDIDSKALTASDIGIEKGLKYLEDKNLSIHDFNKVSNAISTFHKMGKLALGEPTEHIRNEGRHDVNFNTTSQQRILKQEGYTG